MSNNESSVVGVNPLDHEYSGSMNYKDGIYKFQEISRKAVSILCPTLAHLATKLQTRIIEYCTSEQFCQQKSAQLPSAELKRLLDHYGSDKGTKHTYHFVYGRILADSSQINGILEIGLGTNNVDVPSNMGGQW